MEQFQDQFVRTIQASIEQKGLLADGDHVVIGLSGGADSVCLLLVLKRLQAYYHLSLTAIHVHHGIRGESADRDLLFSKKLCEKEGVEFVEEHRDVPAIAKKLHQTEEEAGRHVRYEIFEEEARKRNANVIAVAHHMDDQAETVLMNLLRGSGIRGCSGISPKRRLSDQNSIFVVRPLLDVRKSAIEKWLTKNGQNWCTDETNLTDEYLRSRIRNGLIPLLEEKYNAQATEHIAGAAGDFFEAEEYFEDQARILFKSWQTKKKEDSTCVSLPIAALSVQKPILQRYLIREAIRKTGSVKDITRTHIESVLSLLQKQMGRQINLPGKRVAFLSYESLIIENKKEKKVDEQKQDSKTGTSIYSIFPVFDKKTPQIPQNCCVNWFDYDTIKEGLLMRRRRPKDRICIDANGNTQKLSDCMVNAKIPAARRDQIPILAENSRVLWIAGVRMAENCKITSKTKLVLSVRTEEAAGKSCDHDDVESQDIG